MTSEPDFGVVFGCPRSGTTFVLRALNAAPATVCLNGIIFPAAIPQILNQPVPEPVRAALRVEFKESLLRYLRSGLFHARATALQKWKSARTGPGALWDALRGQQAVERLIYKEPFFSFAPEFAYDALPGAPLVYIYRDGRDCADSLTRTYDVLTDEKLTHLRSAEMRFGRKVDHRYVPWWVEDGDDDAFLAASPYVRAVWMWKAMVNRCEAFFARPEVAASGRILRLRYEDLMRDPLPQGEAVAAHLGVPFSRGMRKRLESAHTRSIGNHRGRPPEDLRAAERLAAAELARNGYR